MAYNKTIWVNDRTKVNAKNMNHIEEGIEAVDRAVENLAQTVDGQLLQKQDTLVSGLNIKTLDGQSILGAGNITIGGGSGHVHINKEILDQITAPFTIELEEKINNSEAALSTKQDLLISGENIVTINGRSLLEGGNIVIKGTVDEEELNQAIAGVKTEVETYADVKIAENLTDYYKKSETYSQTEVNNLIAAIRQLTFKKVNSIEEVTEEGIIYLVPNEQAIDNSYDEYILIDGQPEKIGSTEIDLSDYAKTADVDSKLAEKQDTIEDIDTIRESANNALSKDEFEQARTEIEEEIKAIEVGGMKYQIVNTTGDVELTANTLTSYAVTPEAGITSLKISLPAEINMGYQSEVNFRGYYGHNVTINSSLPIYYMQYGLPCNKPELSINAYISFLFNFDGLKLTCYVSEVLYNS